MNAHPAASILVNSVRRSIVLLCALGLGSVRAHAQSSRSSLADVGVVNSAISPYIGALNSNQSDTGATVSAAATQSFTGMDRNSSQQTMTFTGSVTASAQYGQLHSSAAGTVTNTYYNANNPAYYDSNANTFNPAGSPDSLASIGFASFIDTLQFGGALQAGYQARYIFHIDGSNSGYGALADLGVNIAGNNEAFFAADVGNFSADWATRSYAINGTTPQMIMVQFSDQFSLGTADVADGSTLSGQSNFSDTVTLSGIQILDANGNLVSGVTITSASGTNYSTVVPEPKTLALLLPALGWLVLAARRKARQAGGALPA